MSEDLKNKVYSTSLNAIQTATHPTHTYRFNYNVWMVDPYRKNVERHEINMKDVRP